MLDLAASKLRGENHMSKRKNLKQEPPADGLIEKIKKLVEGLSYTSETDAEIEPFAGGKADAVTKESLLAQIGASADSVVKEKKIDEFFARLTDLQDWFGEEEKETAGRFSKLRDLLQKELKDLKVFKIGETEIDIYVVGLDSQNRLMGIKTKSVET